MNSSPPRGPAAKFVTIEHGSVAFDVPESWVEDSVVTVAIAGAAPRPTLSLNRMSAPPEETLDTTITRRLTESSPVFPLEVVEMQRTHAAGHWGMEVIVTLPMEDEKDLILQRMVFLKGHDAVWVMAGSSTKKLGRGVLAYLDHALATLQLPRPRGGW